MLDISDVGEFAKGFYGPLVILVMTLVVLAAFFRVRLLAAKVFGYLDDFLTGAKDGTKAPDLTYIHLVLALFVLFAWPPFFQALGNLVPLAITSFSEIEREVALSTSPFSACAVSGHRAELATYLAVNEIKLDAPGLANAQQNASRAVSMIFFAFSLTGLWFLAFVASLFSRSLVHRRPWLILAVPVICILIALQGLVDWNNALRHAAQLKADAVTIHALTKLTDDERKTRFAGCDGEMASEPPAERRFALQPETEALIAFGHVSLRWSWPRLDRIVKGNP